MSEAIGNQAGMGLCRRARRWCAPCALLLVDVVAAAPPPGSSVPVPVDALVQVVLALGAVVAMIVGGAWLLRRVGGFSGIANGRLRVVAGASLGARERVVLLQVGGQQLLLGVAPGRVSMLHVLETRLEEGKGDDAQPGSFAALLRRRTAAAANPKSAGL